MQKKVLVTGASGFIGSHLVKELKVQGYEVTEFAGDITKVKEVEGTFEGQEFAGVFHVAAILPDTVKSPSNYIDVNVKGTLHVLEACVKHNILTFIYSSSMSVYGHDITQLPVDEAHATNPYDLYSLSKLQGEELVSLYTKEHGLNAVILRYAGVYGKGKNSGAAAAFLKNAMERQLLEVRGNTKWDLVYVQDVAMANILAFEKAIRQSADRGAEIFNIGSGVETSIKELAEQVKEVTGSSLEIRIIESAEPAFRFFYNIAKAKEKLGFAPRSLQEGLKAYYDSNH